jgi:hypothetical protein
MPGEKKSRKQSTAATKRSTGVSSKTPKTRAKAPVKKKTPAAVAPNPMQPRQLRPPRKRAYLMLKRLRHPVKIQSSWKITKRTMSLVRDNWKLIGGIVLVYGVIDIILVRGITGGADVRELKQEFNQLFHGTLGHVATGFSIFALLVTSSTSASASTSSSAYESFLILAVSLALIWAYRQVLAGKKVRIRDSFYRGMYPIIPFILVLGVVALELLPLVGGGWLYSIVLENGIAVNGPEQLLCFLIFVAFVMLSIYMVCSSVFALYIVTLPDMTPLKALRTARQLVRYRRWSVMRKFLFLPFILLLLSSLFMFPFILFLAVAAQWIFFGLTMFMLAAAHGYMYTLYRELLREK